MSAITLKYGKPKPLNGFLGKKLNRWYRDIKEGWFAADCTKPFAFDLTKGDIAHGVPFDCVNCAIGKAAQRHGLHPAIAAKSGVAFFIIKSKKLVVRVTVPSATRRVIITQDVRGRLSPQIVHFTAITPSVRLGARPNRPHQRNSKHTNPSLPSGLRNI